MGYGRLLHGWGQGGAEGVKVVKVVEGVEGNGNPPGLVYINRHSYNVGMAAPAIAILSALADATRLAIVERLGRGERCVSELCVDTGVKQSLISFHLKVLRGAGLVAGHRSGRTVWYAIDPNGFARLEQFVRSLRGRSGPPEDRSRAADLETCLQYINGN